MPSRATFTKTLRAKLSRLASKHPKTVTALKVGLVFGLVFMVCWQRLDPDFGWHLAAGDYMRVNGIPAHDIFTYQQPAFAWINHEWASDVLVSWLYQIGGYALLAAVFASIWTASLCLFRDKIRLAITLVAAVGITPYLGVRSMAWTALGIILLLELIKRRSRLALALIPLLFLVWANLHGGFIAGLAILVYFSITKRRLLWLWLALAGFLATLINPYGAGLYSEIGRTVLDQDLHGNIYEWQRFLLLPATWLFIVLWGTGFWLFDRRKLSNWYGLSPILLLASLSATRNVPLFVIVALRDLDDYSQQIKLPSNLDRPRKIIITAFFGVVIGFLAYMARDAYFPYGRESYYPAPAVSYLQSQPCPGNIFNHYSWGGYLIWKLPSTKVYIDGRTPSWRQPEGDTFVSRYYDILDKPEVRRKEFDRYNIRCAVLEDKEKGPDQALIGQLRGEGWQPVASGNESVLLIKN